jgi:hypothetical protein
VQTGTRDALRVIVSSNCQTSGITAALRVLLPGDQVDPFPWPSAEGDHRSALVHELAMSDVWVVTASPAWVEGVLAECTAGAPRVVTAPELYFDAFHPDLVYAWLPGDVLLSSVTGPYHSAIALWAWRHGLDADAAAALFVPEVFARVGYVGRWSACVARLQRDFAQHGLDHRDFILPMQRRGVFMHSVNHPRIDALARLGRQIAGTLGATPEALAEPIEDFLVDGLMVASPVWPVYPGIGDSLALPTSFTWKLTDQSVIRLREFLEACFSTYAALDPETISCPHVDWDVLDAVLATRVPGGVP